MTVKRSDVRGQFLELSVDQVPCDERDLQARGPEDRTPYKSLQADSLKKCFLSTPFSYKNLSA